MIKISVLLPYANPHVIGWINELNALNDYNVNIGCVYKVENFRKNYFNEYDYLDNVKYFFKPQHTEKFDEALKQTNVFITLGIFNKDFIKAILKLEKSTVVYVISEPHIDFSFSKVLLKKIYVKLILLFIKQKNIRFLAIGGQEMKKQYLELGFRKSNFYNFGYFPSVKPVLKSTEVNKIKFLFVGQLIPRKGIDVLINLIDYLEHNYKDKWEFEIIGDGELKEHLHSSIKDYKSVKYLGLINDSKILEEYYENSHVLFLPSYFDGWGAVVNEALAKSCSLLLSNKVYAANCLLEEGVNGYLFNPKDFETLKQKVDQYFFNKDILQKHFKQSYGIYNEWNSQNAAYEVNNLLTLEKNKSKTLLKEI